MGSRIVIWSSRWNGPVAVVLLILVVVALLLPAVQQAREAARHMQSRSNLKEIGLALHNYHNNRETFPPGGVFDADGKPFHGWMILITPYLDASPWYAQVNFDIPWDHPKQIAHFQPGYNDNYLNPSIFLRCGDDGLVRTHYAGNQEIFYHNSSTRLSDLTSGTSQTFMAGDASDHFQPFGYAYNWRNSTSGLNTSSDGFGCAVRNVTQMLLVDGSVRAFSHETDQHVFAAFRGVNKNWKQTPPDVSAPPAPYRVAPPVICLWADPPTCSSLLGVQDDSGQLVRAWFLSSGKPWAATTARLDRQAALLKPHQSLREVNLRNALSDQGIRVLSELPNLEIVRLSGHSVTDRGIEVLSRCQRLKRLELSATQLGDTGWEKLAEAPHLETINISIDWNESVGFSPESVVKFLDLKPNCKVNVSRGRKISIETIRDMAKHNKPWPDYQRGKSDYFMPD